jgi:hypothetical protein
MFPYKLMPETTSTPVTAHSSRDSTPKPSRAPLSPKEEDSHFSLRLAYGTFLLVHFPLAIRSLLNFSAKQSTAEPALDGSHISTISIAVIFLGGPNIFFRPNDPVDSNRKLLLVIVFVVHGVLSLTYLLYSCFFLSRKGPFEGGINVSVLFVVFNIFWIICGVEGARKLFKRPL